MDDFRDVSDYYTYDKNLTLKKVFDEMVASIKEKKARIRINKYHMIFNYYINNDSIMLCLDNEIESSILEKYYENTFRKIYKVKENESLENSKTNLVVDNHLNESKKEMEIIINNNQKENINNNMNIEEKNIDDNNNKENKEKKEEVKEIPKKKEIFKMITMNFSKNRMLRSCHNKLNRSQTILKLSKREIEKRKSPRNIRTRFNEKESEAEREKVTISKRGRKRKTNLLFNVEKNHEKEKEQENKEKNTKKFLYSEFKLSKRRINDKNESDDKEEKKEEKNEKENYRRKKIIDSDDEDESWGESLFYCEEENKKEEKEKENKEKKNNNLLRNKKGRPKTPYKRLGKRALNKNKKLNEKEKENKENKDNKEEEIQIILLNEDEDEDNNSKKGNKNKNDENIINDNNINKNDESKENKNSKKIYSNNNNNNSSHYNKYLSRSMCNKRFNTNKNISNSISNLTKKKIPEKYSSPNPIIQNNLKILQKYMSDISSIITYPLEIFILKEKIEPYNKIFLKLVYSSQEDSDDYDTFRKAVIDNIRQLILIKTEKDRRIAIYLNEKLFVSKGKQDQEIIDMKSFIFSFEKKTFFVPNEKIPCFIQSPSNPYLFKLADNSIYIKNNFKNEKHYLMQNSNIFKINNLFLDLNGGDKEFNIATLEVYKVEIQNI